MGAFGVTPIITLIAFGPGGTLYGTDNEGLSTSFYWIDVETGQASRIGTVGDFVFGLDFGPDGTLYASSSELFTIDPETGAKDRSLGFPGQLFTALDFGTDGILRGLSFGSAVAELFEIDHVHGTTTFVGPTNEAMMWGLASVPEPGTSILLVLGFAVLGRSATRTRVTPPRLPRGLL